MKLPQLHVAIADDGVDAVAERAESTREALSSA